MTERSKRTAQRGQTRSRLATAVTRADKKRVGRSTAARTPLSVRPTGMVLGEKLDAYVRKRIGFKLAKFALHITSVSARFTAVSGSKGKPTYACKLGVVLPNAREVVVSAKAADVREAFDAAADAVERAVRRLLEKRQGAR